MKTEIKFFWDKLKRKKFEKEKRNLVNPSRLDEFRNSESNFEGFFTPEQAALWDCLLAWQASSQITGPMMEIGVYKGRSAFLSALHLNPKEEFVLIDGTPFIFEAKKQLDPLLGKRGVWINKMSFQVASSDLKKRGDIGGFILMVSTLAGR